MIEYTGAKENEIKDVEVVVKLLKTLEKFGRMKLKILRLR